ncbi:flagellar FlbD family protein [Sporichthya polymorpha]|uniref:flagellar FlbD family protein n=1 Tax=Sporichthya polymorpha TaxID=35751 RepID=UPI000370D28D|nr:flagellar FlbD family protein [Sporichthya polymorpha]
MIVVTRLGGPTFAVNPDLIERAEASPDTVVTLVDGTKYVIAESLDELVERIRTYRASVIAAAALAEHVLREASPAQTPAPAPTRTRSSDGTVVALPHRDR